MTERIKTTCAPQFAIVPVDDDGWVSLYRDGVVCEEYPSKEAACSASWRIYMDESRVAIVDFVQRIVVRDLKDEAARQRDLHCYVRARFLEDLAKKFLTAAEDGPLT